MKIRKLLIFKYKQRGELVMETDIFSSDKDIMSVVTKYVYLEKVTLTGNTFLGHCPFHEEKTPSFTVDPNKQTFHCLGCGLNGNVDDFLKLIGENNVSERK
jgi:DNA primase